MASPQRWTENPVALAVLIVGALTFTVVVGTVGLLAMEKEAPDGLIAAMGSGMGSLATLLVSRQNVPPKEAGDP